MTELSIQIFDDASDIAEGWSNRIQLALENTTIDASIQVGDLVAVLDTVRQRREEWRSGNWTRSQQPIDQLDVAIVDYDLLDNPSTSDTTGSRLAYLLRCFTQCGFIVVLNEYGSNVFDLRLGSPTAGFADSHIGDRQISNPGLWHTPFGGYRPWYWPVIPRAAKNFEKCVEDVIGNLDLPILETLGLESVIEWLPRRAIEFLSGRESPRRTTFRHLIRSTEARVDRRDRLPDWQLARVAASRLGALLNSIILPEQSVLVDAPHLVSRLPSVIRHDSDGTDVWSRICDPLEQGIDELLVDDLKQYRFQTKSHWFWRPVWLWPKVSGDSAIVEVDDPWSYPAPTNVFCEDVSRFIPKEFARNVNALVSPPFLKRFICNLKWEGDKSRATRIESHLTPVAEDVSQEFADIEYVPQSALSF
ncbi:MAG: hypothetical protein F4Y42_18090 [Caldilineaceae bacterium SB0664_bin_27]|uniref:Uncharacterized protein n=1 Tax=Caldilineaceae bacterium SB0664_bin_27 TaxID=2605260 RepID=A0A6B0YYT9_9CHLR|nr:hypothetical protein [Caldilineaceae bacterium SB0664_bin_27]